MSATETRARTTPEAPASTASAGWGQRGTAAVTFAARLTLDRVHHAYEDVVAVDEVSLDVSPGEVLCLLGQSGCGKSTLLRVIAGLERQNDGRVLIDGQEIAGPNTFVAPERRGVGLMFQDYALFPHLSVIENTMFGLNRLSRGEAGREALLALRRVGLEDHADRYPHQLSGGEQQRVALARAIVPRPAVLLMDEPLSGLDRRLRDSVRDETLAVLRETRATAIIVTHDPEEAMRMADRVALMRAGRLVQVGTPRDLYDRPMDLFAARFFSELNEVPGIVRAGEVLSPLGVFPLTAPLEPGREVVVGIRPQDLSPTPAGVPGRVVQSRFLGEVEHLEIAVSGIDSPLRCRTRDLGRSPVGADIGVRVASENVLIFPK